MAKMYLKSKHKHETTTLTHGLTICARIHKMKKIIEVRRRKTGLNDKGKNSGKLKLYDVIRIASQF